MKKLIIALLITGASSMVMAQSPTKTKNTGTVIKTKDNNGVKTKHNLETGVVKKKDDVAGTKTKTNSTAGKTGMAVPVPKEGTTVKGKLAKKKEKKTGVKTSK